MTHGYENEAFEEQINCMIENKCLHGVFPRDGACLGTDEDAVNTNLEAIRGNWVRNFTILSFVNCGRSDKSRISDKSSGITIGNKP